MVNENKFMFKVENILMNHTLKNLIYGLVLDSKSGRARLTHGSDESATDNAEDIIEKLELI